MANKLPASPSGHAWIELRDEDTRLFTIDITLDQFAEWEDWYMGVGPTPALEKFSRPDYVGQWRDWSVIKSNPTYQAYAAKVVRFLS